MTGTPHIEAARGDFADLVLMPGDPLRAKALAEGHLENVRLVNSVRNMLAFTGSFGGKPVSIMGSGMGMPSISIYAHELFDYYGVKKIVRVGTCGGLVENMVAAFTELTTNFDIAKIGVHYTEKIAGIGCLIGSNDVQIGFVTSRKIVSNHNFLAQTEQSVGQMRADESATAGDQPCKLFILKLLLENLEIGHKEKFATVGEPVAKSPAEVNPKHFTAIWAKSVQPAEAIQVTSRSKVVV